MTAGVLPKRTQSFPRTRARPQRAPPSLPPGCLTRSACPRRGPATMLTHPPALVTRLLRAATGHDGTGEHLLLGPATRSAARPSAAGCHLPAGSAALRHQRGVAVQVQRPAL